MFWSMSPAVEREDATTTMRMNLQKRSCRMFSVAPQKYRVADRRRRIITAVNLRVMGG